MGLIGLILSLIIVGMLTVFMFRMHVGSSGGGADSYEDKVKTVEKVKQDLLKIRKQHDSDQVE